MNASAVGEKWDMLNINLKNNLSRFDQGFNNKEIKFSYLKTQILMLQVLSLVLFSESLNLPNSVVLNDRKYLGLFR